jgi:hypothetical protein
MIACKPLGPLDEVRMKEIMSQQQAEESENASSNKQPPQERLPRSNPGTNPTVLSHQTPMDSPTEMGCCHNPTIPCARYRHRDEAE